MNMKWEGFVVRIIFDFYKVYILITVFTRV